MQGWTCFPQKQGAFACIFSGIVACCTHKFHAQNLTNTQLSASVFSFNPYRFLCPLLVRTFLASYFHIISAILTVLIKSMCFAGSAVLHKLLAVNPHVQSVYFINMLEFVNGKFLHFKPPVKGKTWIF